MSVLLRKMEYSDLEMVLNWRNSESVRKNMYTHHKISSNEHLNWWKDQHIKESVRLLLCEVENIAVGVVTFTNYTGEGGGATWAFYSGDTSKRGTGPAMEKAGLCYAFETLKVRRLECEVLEFNEQVIKFHIKHGFTVEGIMRDAYIRDEKAYDIYKLSILRKEWVNFIKPNLDSLGNKSSHSLTGKKFNFEYLLSSELVDKFSSSVNDKNPIHLHSLAAQKSGFQDKIVHGMLSGSLFSGFFSEKKPGPGTVYLGQSLKFLRVIPVDEKVNVVLNFLSHIGRKVKVSTKIYHKGELCIDGEAELLAPKKHNSSQNTI